VRVERHSGVDGFLDRAGEFLARRETEHNLILGLCSRLRHDPLVFGSEPYLATVSSRDRVVAAALRTPPHNLVLSEVEDERACLILVEDAGAVFETMRGALGPVGPVDAFVRGWEERTGARARLEREERIYRADRVVSPEYVPGRMRAYSDSDRALAVDWLEAFMSEAMGGSAIDSAEDVLSRRLEDPEGGLVVWEHGDVVSLAGFGGPTPNGIRIGPVYTPPELRRRGYATALVAELTRALLVDRRFCFLFTDLANPTSNSIYQRVGYEPVTDVNEWVFEPG
jgi:uncharacterized protein